MSVRPHYLDVTSVIDREEIATAFGIVTAWRTAITQLTAREAREKDARKKRLLRLQLLNAHTQLSLLTKEQRHG